MERVFSDRSLLCILDKTPGEALRELPSDVTKEDDSFLWFELLGVTTENLSGTGIGVDVDMEDRLRSKMSRPLMVDTVCAPGDCCSAAATVL